MKEYPKHQGLSLQKLAVIKLAATGFRCLVLASRIVIVGGRLQRCKFPLNFKE